MRILLGLTAMIVAVSATRADDKWPVEFGFDAKTLVSGPVGQQVKKSLGKDYEKLNLQFFSNAGGLTFDDFVFVSGGLMKLPDLNRGEPFPNVVLECASAESAMKIVKAMKAKEVKPKGFIKDFPNAVGYERDGGGEGCILDGARLMPVRSVEGEEPDVYAKVFKYHDVLKKTTTKDGHQFYLYTDGQIFNFAKQQPLPEEMGAYKAMLNATAMTLYAKATDQFALETKMEFVNETDVNDAKEAYDKLHALMSLGINQASTELKKNPEDAPKGWQKVEEMVRTLHKGAKGKIEGTSLVVKTSAPMPDTLGVIVAEVMGVTGEAGSRMTSSNNLRQIALGLHNHHDIYNAMPSNIYSKDEKPKALLSWRVQLLPYLEQEELYRQFKLDEPWDSENNKKLIAKMPKIFVHPKQDEKSVAAGKTHYRAFAPEKKDGIKCMLPAFPGEKWSMTAITDGLSNTIFCVEAAEPVEWTKPDGLVFDLKGKLPKLGGLTDKGFNAALGDGSVRFLKSTIKDETLKAMITANGGEVVSDE